MMDIPSNSLEAVEAEDNILDRKMIKLKNNLFLFLFLISEFSIQIGLRLAIFLPQVSQIHQDT